jgi:orotidine-5'-phosphate decarboxylase
MPLAHPEIPVRERLIVALDYAEADAARALVERLGDSVHHYKIGLELLTGGEYFALLAELKAAGKRVFADLKLHDIPATVAAAVAGMRRHAPDLLTLHAYPAAIAAARAVAGDTALLAVTVLTSMGAEELAADGLAGSPAEVVLRRARAAVAAGARGLVCSGQEAALLRRELGRAPLIVCPGIRTTAGGDDQKRTVSVAEAFVNGADYIVVGRPIRQSEDPAASARLTQELVNQALEQQSSAID